MYLYFLKIAFDNERYDFQISDVAVSKELGLTRKTIKSTKEKLKSLGLIQFQTKNGLPCNYRLLLDYPLSVSEPKNVIKEEIKKEEFIQKEEKLVFPSPTVPPIQNFFENTVQKVEAQSSREKSNNKNTPSWEEFIEFAQTLEIYESQLDFEIQTKYESWKNNEWKNHVDRPITNWKSALKSALPFMKKTTEGSMLSLKSIPNINRPKSLSKK
ncbi:hypothetical protein QGN23_01155 [Chryseobacterium gotjawalense]|uniref:Helix-turn-helix domain-containing protein n=1 Tax=Chryseobacterium gotjawalense TaxID=3042315 RepID=A0ABY8RD39_9FLAO|nr:hypothetical protein [Chryseobacterium sp. wdc7]WHF51900.1 hypothetical protein QGN23_01155 [Chryseobacterium sp. wdc7]